MNNDLGLTSSGKEYDLWSSREGKTESEQAGVVQKGSHYVQLLMVILFYSLIVNITPFYLMLHVY